jgi:hypothetical protein
MHERDAHAFVVAPRVDGDPVDFARPGGLLVEEPDRDEADGPVVDDGDPQTLRGRPPTCAAFQSG